MILCPETNPVIHAAEPQASNALTDTALAVSLEGADGVLMTVYQLNTNASSPLILTVNEGATKTVAEAGTYPLAVVFPIWSNLDCATNDTMVRRSDAVTYTVTASAADVNVVHFYIPAAILTDGREWVQIDATASGHASNLVSVTYQLDKTRYKSVTPPTAVA